MVEIVIPTVVLFHNHRILVSIGNFWRHLAYRFSKAPTFHERR